MTQIVLLVMLCSFAIAASVVAGTTTASLTSQSVNPANEFGNATCFPEDATIFNFAFDPEPIVVDAGCTVRWTNTVPTQHDTVSDDALWDSGNLSDGESFSYTFNTPGTYLYSCTLHPATMSGFQVIVN